MDGMRFRTEKEAQDLMEGFQLHGVQSVNFTFYGLQSFHDRFAARRGDFEHLLTLARCAVLQKLETTAGIPLTAENTEQITVLLGELERYGIHKIFLFIPHEEGRGENLSPIRFSEADFEKLGEKAGARLNRNVFRPEQEWVRGIWPEEENRSLIISLTPENIGWFEQMGFPQVIRYVEALDEAYYSAIPTFGELCCRYGDPAGTNFYSKRDLFLRYQKRFIAENNLQLYDVTDERFCGSRRF